MWMVDKYDNKLKLPEVAIRFCDTKRHFKDKYACHCRTNELCRKRKKPSDQHAVLFKTNYHVNMVNVNLKLAWYHGYVTWYILPYISVYCRLLAAVSNQKHVY